MVALFNLLARRSVNALNKRARELMDKGAMEEALNIALKACEKSRKTFSVNSSEFLQSHNTLAAINVHLEHWETAKAILLEVVGGTADGDGVESEEYAIALNNLAQVYVWQDRETEAVQYMQRAIVLKRKLFGVKSPRYLGNLQDLAMLLGRMDRDSEALPYFEEMCEIIEVELGDEDPEYAKALQNLAVAMQSSGRGREAAVIQLRVERILAGPEWLNKNGNLIEEHDENSYRDDHDPQVQQAFLLYAQGERKKAQTIQRRVLAKLPKLPLPAIFEQAMGNPLDPFLTRVGKLDEVGLAAENAGNLDEAAASFEQIAAILEVSLGERHPHYAGALNNVAQVRRKQRRFGDATELFRSALAILEGMAEGASPKSDIATNIASMYLEIVEEIAPDPSRATKDLRKILGEKPDDFTISMRIRFPTHIEDELPVSNTMRWLDARAKFYESIGAFDKVEFIRQKAVELVSLVRGEHHADVLEPLDALVQSQTARGKFAEAAEHLARAISVAELTDSRRLQLAQLLESQAKLASNVGQGEVAERLMVRAIDLLREAGVSESDLLGFEENLAVLRLRMGHVDLARPVIERILARASIEELEKTDPAQVQRLATFADAIGDHEQALRLYQTSIHAQREKTGEWTPSFARTLSNYGTALRGKGRWQEAEVQYRRAVEIRRVLLGSDHPDLLESLIRLALVLGALDRPGEAFAAANDALTIGARLTGRLSAMSSEVSRLNLVRRQLDHMNIALSIVQGSLAKDTRAIRRGYELVLRRKAIAAQALVVQRNAILGGRYPHLEQELRDLDSLRAEIVRNAMRPPDPDHQEEQSRLLSEAIEERSKIEAALARDVREIALEAPLAAATIEAVATALPKDSVLIEFVELRPFNFKGVQAAGHPESLPRRYIAFVLPSGRPDDLSLVDFGEADEIDALILGLAGQAGQRLAAADRNLALTSSGEHRVSYPHSAASKVLDRLVLPMMTAMGQRKQLLIAPDGNLFLVAFETLPLDDQRLLIDECEVSYLGTGRDAIRFASEASTRVSEVAIVAAPDFDLSETVAAPEAGDTGSGFTEARGERGWIKGLAGRFAALPGAVSEGEEVFARFPGARLLTGRDAVKSSVRRLKRPAILHFATHGFALPPSANEGNSDVMLRSGLALAGANAWLDGGTLPPEAEDGFITAEDIATLDLIDTEMAVLSACETGVGEVLSGEGVFGLRRAFSVAGVRSTVMSLWKVPDEETKELMVAFYDNLLKGVPRPTALRAAKLALRSRGVSPQSWGAFICEGDWHPLRTIAAAE